MGGSNSAATEASVRAMLDRAAGALSQLLTPFPFLFGERPGQADLFLFYNLDIAERVSRFVYQRPIIDEIGRSAERRVGQEGVRQCRSRGSPHHEQKKIHNT